MEQRRFGRSGHLSTLAIFGAFALSRATQDEAEGVMAQVMEAGVNHIDVAPSYGDAELRLGPVLARERDRFFLGCKTGERTRAGAAAEMERSLTRLQVDAFDLYQLHAVNSLQELDAVTGPGGALEALRAARERGQTRYLGITGHGLQAPAVFLEALRRFDFDSVLFPVNFILFADPAYRQAAEALLETCRARDVGVMAIKALASGPWGESSKTYNTWYRPFEVQAQIDQAVRFTLSQTITGYCTAGEMSLLPKILDACERFRALQADEQAALIASAVDYQPIFR